jgi:hypothetical protein
MIISLSNSVELYESQELTALASGPLNIGITGEETTTTSSTSTTLANGAKPECNEIGGECKFSFRCSRLAGECDGFFQRCCAPELDENTCWNYFFEGFPSDDIKDYCFGYYKFCETNNDCKEGICNEKKCEVEESTTTTSVSTTTIPKATDCTLTKADWSPEFVNENEIVQLKVQGTNCEEKKIQFEIYEIDLIDNDPVKNNSEPTQIQNGEGITTWKAEWQDDRPSRYPEYKFIAKYADQRIESEIELKVKKFIPPPKVVLYEDDVIIIYEPDWPSEIKKEGDFKKFFLDAKSKGAANLKDQRKIKQIHLVYYGANEERIESENIIPYSPTSRGYRLESISRYHTCGPHKFIFEKDEKVIYEYEFTLLDCYKGYPALNKDWIIQDIPMSVNHYGEKIISKAKFTLNADPILVGQEYEPLGYPNVRIEKTNKDGSVEEIEVNLGQLGNPRDRSKMNDPLLPFIIEKQKNLIIMQYYYSTKDCESEYKVWIDSEDINPENNVIHKTNALNCDAIPDFKVEMIGEWPSEVIEGTAVSLSYRVTNNGEAGSVGESVKLNGFDYVNADNVKYNILPFASKTPYNYQNFITKKVSKGQSHTRTFSWMPYCKAGENSLHVEVVTVGGEGEKQVDNKFIHPVEIICK